MPKRKLIRLCTVLTMTALVACALLDNVMARLPEGWRTPVRVVVGMIAAGVLGHVLRRRRNAGRGRAEQSPQEGCGPSKDEIYRYAEQVRDRYVPVTVEPMGDDGAPKSSTAIDTFTFLLIDGGHIARVSEHVRVGGDVLVDDVTIEVSLLGLDKRARAPLPEDAPVVVPILRRKEVVRESFEARDGGDNRLVQLPQQVTDGLLAWAVKGLFQMIYLPPGGTPAPAQNAMVYRLIMLICRTDVIPADDFEGLYDQIVPSSMPAQHGEDPQQLRRFCAYFAANTVSAIEAPGGTDTIHVKYRDVTVNDRLDTAHDRQRTRFGITPYRYRIPVNFAFAAPIYHLRITGPESQFVHTHYLSRPVPQIATEKTMGVRLDRNDGVYYTGLHTRGLNRLTEPVELECVAEFEEIPPGMLRRALVVAAISATVTLAFAFVMPSAVRDSRGTDFAAFLLAVPGFAATLVGISAERVQQSSLTTFGGLVVAGTISFASSVLYVIQSLVWQHSPHVRLSVLGLLRLPAADTFWLLLAALSITTTFYLALESMHRMHRYMSALRRRPSAT